MQDLLKFHPFILYIFVSSLCLWLGDSSPSLYIFICMLVDYICVFVCVCVHACMYDCMYVYMYMYMYMYVCMYHCLYVCIYMYVYWGGYSHGKDVLWWWPPFWVFSIRLEPDFIHQHNPIDPLFWGMYMYVWL